MFSVKHIIILLISIASIVGLYFLTRKWTLRNKFKGFLIIAVISEAVKIFYYIMANEAEYGGILPKSDLPFQLCSIQILFSIFILFAKGEKVKRAVMAFMYPSGLIGGAAAILIPTYSALNAWVITFQYFIFHVVLITLALHILTDKELKLTIKDYFSSLIFILILMFFAIYINSMMYDGVSDVNFMYVVSPPVSGLPFLNENNGWFVYIMHYALVILVSITLCYIKQIIVAVKEKIKNKQASPADEVTE